MARELTNEEYKKLQRIEKRIKKAAKEISDMGFGVYLNMYSLCIMDGPTHGENCEAIRENTVYSIDNLHGWDGGDW